MAKTKTQNKPRAGEPSSAKIYPVRIRHLEITAEKDDDLSDVFAVAVKELLGEFNDGTGEKCKVVIKHGANTYTLSAEYLAEELD